MRACHFPPTRSGARAALLVAAVAAAAGCRAAQTAPAPRSIKLVSSLPRTGAARAQTDSIVNSIRLALRHADGRVGDQLVDYDDWNDAPPEKGDWDADAEAANAARAIADPNVLVYLGTYNSGAAKVSLPLLNQAGLATISPANTYPGLTKPGACEPNEPAVYRPSGRTNYYRVVPTDEIQGRAAAQFAAGMGWRTVYVLFDGGLYGQGITDIFTDTAHSLGLTLLSPGPQKIDPGAPQYHAQIRRIAMLRPSIVYFGGTTQAQAGVVARDLLQALPPSTKLMVPDGCYQTAFIRAAGAALLEGRVFVTFGGIPPGQMVGPGGRYLADYRQAYGADPESYGIFGYVAAQAALDAIGKAARKDREGVRAALATVGQVGGPLGSWRFDEAGDTSLSTISVSVVKRGRFAFLTMMGGAAP